MKIFPLLVVGTYLVSGTTADFLRGVIAPLFSSTSASSSTEVSFPGVGPDTYSKHEVADAIHELNRRRKKPKKDKKDDKEADEFLGGRLLIDRVDGDYMSDEIQDEVDLIEKSFVKAYNDAHPNGDYVMTSMTLEKETVIPEDIPSFMSASANKTTVGYDIPYFYVSWIYRFGYHCRLCREDDYWDYPPSLQSKETVKTSDHRDFEDIFCFSLKGSDLKEFKTVTDCSIIFDRHDNLGDDQKTSEDLQKKKKKKEEDDEDGTGEGSLLIDHVNLAARKDLALEVAEVESAFVSAYNEAHGNADFQLTSMTMDSEMEIPEEKTLANMRGGNAVGYDIPYFYVSWIYRFGYHCRLCREDDYWDVPPLLSDNLEDENVKGAHRDFEVIFCRILKHSKLAEFVDVGDCSISFKYHKDDTEDLAANIKEE